MAPPITSVAKFCERCRTAFRAILSHVKVGRGRFCSRACANSQRPDRFWRMVSKSDGCWLWVGRRDRGGYGRSQRGGRFAFAHRLAWEFARGQIPDGMCVLHNCPGGDNPACCNPNHLFLGTQLANVADMVTKGRQAKGRAKPNAKLTAEEVLEIRAKAAAGSSRRAIASEYGVSKTAIHGVLSRKTWRHVA